MTEPRMKPFVAGSVEDDLYQALVRYEKEYSTWEQAVSKIIGHTPDTGIHLNQARAAIARYQVATRHKPQWLFRD